MGNVRQLHPVPTYQEVLRAKITSKEQMQARRRAAIDERVTEMERVYDRAQLEIDNLKAQLVSDE